MKPERNAPCPCGSSQKYKKCCLIKADQKDFAWRQAGIASDSLDRKLVAYVQQNYDPEFFELTFDDYFGYHLSDKLDLTPDLLPFIGPLAIFHWYLDEDEDCEGMSLPQGSPAAHFFIKKNRKTLSELELRVFQQHQLNPFSFFMVKSSDPGRGIWVEDLLVPRELYFNEAKGSQSMSRGDIIFAKPQHFAGGLNTLGVMAPWIIPNQFHISILRLKEDIKEELQITRDLCVDDLEDFNDMNISFLARLIDQLLTPMSQKLTNTDGHQIKPTCLTFTITDPKKTLELLAPLNPADSYDDILKHSNMDKKGNLISASFPWLRVAPGDDPRKSNTVLAHLTITPKQLKVEVNSVERGDAFRKKLAELYSGGEIQLSKVEAIEPKVGPLLSEPETEEDKIELEQLTKKLIEEHYGAWPDMEIPALGNLTPREAVKLPQGRETVEALLASFELTQEKHPQPGVTAQTFKKVREDLGL